MSSWIARLRAAIAADGRTTYAIARASGVPVQTVDRIVAGQEPKLGTAEKLGRVVGVQLVARRRSKRAD